MSAFASVAFSGMKCGSVLISRTNAISSARAVQALVFINIYCNFVEFCIQKNAVAYVAGRLSLCLTRGFCILSEKFGHARLRRN